MLGNIKKNEDWDNARYGAVNKRKACQFYQQAFIFLYSFTNIMQPPGMLLGFPLLLVASKVGFSSFHNFNNFVFVFAFIKYIDIIHTCWPLAGIYFKNGNRYFLVKKNLPGTITYFHYMLSASCY